MSCDLKDEISMEYTSSLSSWNLKGKHVVLRVDFNVPCSRGHVADDFRIRAVLPTIDYILGDGGTIILLTHIGRPTKNDPKLSTRCLQKWFDNIGYKAYFAQTIDQAKKLAEQYNNTIIILENLRFFPEEQTPNNFFAHQLAQLGEYFINDAFGTMHRTDTSMTLLPKQFPKEKRCFGFLTEIELDILNRIIRKPNRPFVAILGGGKIASKLPLVGHMLDIADTILLCPAIVFTFAKASGKTIGKSLIDESKIDTCIEIMKAAQKKEVKLEFPADYQVAKGTLNGPLSYTNNDSIEDEFYGISIGPETSALYSDIIKKAGTIFFNGTMGFADQPETMHASHTLLKNMAHARGTKIIAGGDSVAAAQSIGVAAAIDHLSTGGGATLAYLSGTPLPGLDALYDD